MNAAVLFFAVPLLAAQDAAVVEGTAFNRLTHAGLAGVTVHLAAPPQSSDTLYSATTDAAGAFRIEGVKPGEYVTRFEAPRGFQAPNFWDPQCRPFHVAAGNPTRLDIPVAPLGSVRGRVFDPDGQPVPRIRVELFRIHAASGSILTTDSEGGFFADNLGTGAYQLRARPALAGTPLGQKPENIVPARHGVRWRGALSTRRPAPHHLLCFRLRDRQCGEWRRLGEGLHPRFVERGPIRQPGRGRDRYARPAHDTVAGLTPRRTYS